jgi:Eco57I restriction-modification methylase
MKNTILPTRELELPLSFLNEAYRSLGFEDGVLLDAVSTPSPATDEIREWLEKGDWLALAKKIGAEKVFFVNEDPVIVFCKIHNPQDIKGLINVFRQAWCMTRPRCLFLAIPGELRVYALNTPPPKDIRDWERIEPLAVAKRISEVGEKLQAFRREHVESGRLFADKYFGDVNERADRRLIHDLKAVRKSLLADLDQRYAHALIGRAIFVRYLEDRGVLLPTYYEQVAKDHPEWMELLSEPPQKPALTIDWGKRRFDRILRNKEFTYALFSQLADDFNGDMFPRDDDEEQAVNDNHLHMLREFLLGEGDSEQLKLFFWAYDFEIIPIELISSIYEEFYHKNNEENNEEDDKGTHYTPSVLVEYTLSKVLTPDCLETNPKILDPACGSGIFLVEAFRRIVRFRVQQQQGRMPSSDELRQILRDQITGIEINREATHVAAFSLYLALLHYQEPPDILATKRLPCLIAAKEQLKDEQHYQILFNTNTFSLTMTERSMLEEKVLNKKAFVGRADVERLLETSQILDIELQSVDVVIGNPPWFEASSKIVAKGEDVEPAGNGNSQAILWAKAHNRPVGEASYSQLFIYRALSLVKETGIIGLLVHSSVIFNQRSTSQKFRQVWLSETIIIEVINFSQVRRLFFDKSVAPFVFVCFAPKQKASVDSFLTYQSARLTRAAEQLRSVVLTNADRRIIRQSELMHKDYLWKTYWLGTHRDAALLAALDSEAKLNDCLKDDDPEPGYGFQFGTKPPSSTLRTLRPLKSKDLQWYGPLKGKWFESPPKGVKRQPDERLYEGQRLLVVRGIKASYGVCARLEYDDFSFRHTIYCVPLPSLSAWKAKLILGVFWSALGRYRLFMTSGSWGAWYDQTVPSDILSMPIKIPREKNAVVKKIVSVVDSIRSTDFSETDSLDDDLSLENIALAKYLETLNEAVFDLFELSSPERELVHDFIDYKFDLFCKGSDSMAQDRIRTSLQSSIGTFIDLPPQRDLSHELEGYLYAFLQVWNREFEPKGEFRWRVIRPDNIAMLAVVFTTQEKGAALPSIPQDSGEEWEWVLERCEDILLQPISQQVYINAIVRAVTDTDIFIVKRDERWLWTRSAAREDAEATLLQAMQMQIDSRGQ